MKTRLITAAIWATACALSTTASAQKRLPQVASVTPVTAPSTTIYKLVDDSGRVTYSNLPLKGAVVVELDPLTVLPSPARTTTVATPTLANYSINTPEGSNSQPPTVMVMSTQMAAPPQTVAMVQTTLPNVDGSTQKKRDETRRRILEDELKSEAQLLGEAKAAVIAQEADRTVVQLMRVAAEKQTPAAYAEARRNYDLREERLRALNENISGHEKNVDALRRELAALK